MLHRRDIHRDHVMALIELQVRSDQRHLVAANVMTLAEAPYETGSSVWGLWDEEVPVGLLAMVHPEQFLWHDPGDDREAAYLWRLMIDQRYQGRGYGRAAIAEALDQARDWHCPRLAASVANVPDSNIGFYERLGFRRTGRIVEGELVISMDVGPTADPVISR
jgi:diamine N-acetyltransferase